MRLEGKTAIITGAGQRIGRAIALEFAAEGADMVLADIQYDKAAQVAALVGEQGRTVIAVRVDVTRSGQVEAMVQQALDTFDRVDVLVNNAGGSGNAGLLDIEDITEETWNATLELNLKGTFLCCRAGVPQMRRQGFGRIVNISSASAKAAFGPLAARPRII